MLPRSPCSWLALLALCGALCAPSAMAEEAHNIPPHLLECYQDEDLYHRENRLPSTMPMVVSLLRQIEESPGFTMDARSFVLSLLHMFRVDGVERDPQVVASERTIPFGLTGQQYNKHRILMKNLIPRSSFLFPNDTLNEVQKCSLHFMMSNSLDKIQRGDEFETCRSVGGNSPTQRGKSRKSRDTDVTDDAEDDAAGVADDEVEAVPLSGTDAPDQDLSAPDVADPPAANPDAEIISQSEMPSVANGNGTDKGNMIWNADGEGPAPRSAPAAAQLQLPESDCPVENGVVYTRWGSVQLGTLLAGIAAGFETQLVTIKDIKTGSNAIKGLSDTLEIDNRYAATLAGDLAEVALWRGPRNTVEVGASGNWNSSQAHRWYFIKQSNEMTDTEIRGGLDGLIMAHHVKDWNNKAGQQLRLSTILERYYSMRGVFHEDYRACERQNHYGDIANSEKLKLQTTSFAYGLYDATPSMLTITSEGLSDYASDAVEALSKKVRASSQMETTCQSTTTRLNGNAVAVAKVDLVFVPDCKWNFEEIDPALLALGREINLHPTGSKITVVGASSHEVLFDTTDQLHILQENMDNNATVYKQCPRGLKLNDLLNNFLRDHFTNQLVEEKNNKEASILSRVVVIMPDEGYEIPSSEFREIETRLDEYRKDFPDVRFVVFTSKKKDSYKILVEDSDQDIIEFHYSIGDTIDTLELAERLKTVPRRIANHVCGPDWKESNYDLVSIYDTIPNQHIAYYRIHSKYLFGIGSETIKIREQNKGEVTVCYSRTQEYPHEQEDSEDDDITCESVEGSEVEIPLNNPCGGSNSYQSCNPLYISVEVTTSKLACYDDTCKDVDDVSVTLSHSHLTCGAAALRSPIMFAVAVIFMISKILFSS